MWVMISVVTNVNDATENVYLVGEIDIHQKIGTIYNFTWTHDFYFTRKSGRSGEIKYRTPYSLNTYETRMYYSRDQMQQYTSNLTPNLQDGWKYEGKVVNPLSHAVQQVQLTSKYPFYVTIPHPAVNVIAIDENVAGSSSKNAGKSGGVVIHTIDLTSDDKQAESPPKKKKQAGSPPKTSDDEAGGPAPPVKYDRNHPDYVHDTESGESDSE
jgi:hypothetical protein